MVRTQRRVAFWLALIMLGAQGLEARELEGVKKKKWLSGKALILEMDFTEGDVGRQEEPLAEPAAARGAGWPAGRLARPGGRILLVKRKNRRRKWRVKVKDPGWLEKLRTGMDLSAGGSWWNKKNWEEADEEPEDPGDVLDEPEDPAAAELEFQADSITASGGPVAPQPIVVPAQPTPDELLAAQLNTLGATTVGATAAAATAFEGNGGYINVTQGGGTWVWNDLFLSSLGVLVIPITAMDPVTKGTCRAGAATHNPPLNRNQIQGVVFSDGTPNTPTTATVGSTFYLCSNLKTSLTANNSLVAQPVQLNCSGSRHAPGRFRYGIPWRANRCTFDDFHGWADAADAALVARGVNINKYFYRQAAAAGRVSRVYLVPPGPCDKEWAGTAYLGCDGTFQCRAWIAGNHWGDENAIAHELSHNMFMQHAGTTTGASFPGGSFNEYDDLSCAMGWCCDNRCWNMPHAWQMGWNAARTYDAATLIRGRTYNVSLGSQSRYAATDLPVRNSIRVLPWNVPGVGANKPVPLWISFRTRTRGDMGLAAGWDDKVHIHSSGISDPYDSAFTNWETMLGVDETWTHPVLNVTVRRYPSNNPSAAVVTLCRYYRPETYLSCLYSLDYDCNGKAGYDDDACLSLLPPAS
ncbi:expressed protein [Chlorella variabilis]|uniref:Expressed protein n=1 Tax=Chlorella variabilis TaxID=554065 RepID=E1ZL05_CHLVA|nr:expressed protein [Chlorella variabilis]EFN53477.1 expressed protein [Chlorella variabilis]|eukprot:XP_005845579.1 expressed protein [Chlorella variabilis]